MQTRIQHRLTWFLTTACVLAAVSVHAGDHPSSSASASSSASSNPQTAITQAHRLTLEGYYDRASELLDAAADHPGTGLPVALARVEIDERVGRYRPAIQRLLAVEPEAAKSADWHAAMAAMRLAVGEYDAAVQSAKAALKLDAAHMRARMLLGQTLETLGRYDEATATYKWFDAQMHHKLPDRADELVYLGRGFLRYSTLTRNPDIKTRCKHVLQEVYQEAFDYVDSSYWPARLAAADLELEKHNLPEASDDFTKVRAINGKAAEADVGMARIALESWDFDLIEKRVNQALQINPNCVPAKVVLAQGRMLERRYKDAAAVARDALKINPNSIEALSLLATAQLRAGDLTGSKDTQARIAGINPHCAMLYFTMGQWLSAARQYDESAAAFNKAIEYAPWWSDPRTELGLMYMQSGQEAEARKALDASWELDPYNRQTYNVLGLLDELEKFSRFESDHFIFRFDSDKDAVLIPFLAAHMEHVIGEVCDEFGVKLKRKTMIEVFPAHDQFSVRISGRPWITTVGACTGPVIAMDAPRADVAPAPFNWADVLRHEFTHTVTLAATANRIPHWMTEGLAVHEQQIPRDWETCLHLSMALRTDRLFTLETLDWGFMRPRHADDRGLAYAQSEWMIEYITARWGHKAVLDLLHAFYDHRTQPEAFEQVLKIDTKTFIDDFMKWAKKQVASWGLPTEPVGDLVKLKATALLKPGDAAIRAQVAEAAWIAQDWKDVEKWSREALKIDKNQPLALSILGGFLVERGDQYKKADEAEKASDDYAEADRLLRRLRKAQPKNPRAVAGLARVEQAWGEPAEAIDLWHRYIELQPRDPDGYRRLSALYLAADKGEKARPLLEQLYRLDNVDASTPRRIAKIYRAAGKPAAAATWMARAVEVGAYDPDVYIEYGDDCVAASRPADAQRAFEAAITLAPENPHPYEGLSRMYEAKGDAAKAREFADKAREHGGGN